MMAYGHAVGCLPFLKALAEYLTAFRGCDATHCKSWSQLGRSTGRNSLPKFCWAAVIDF